MTGFDDKHAIYLSEPETERTLLDVPQIQSRLRIDVDAGSASDKAGLVKELARAFKFPYVVPGLDASLDLMSSLDWMGSRTGYVVVVRGVGALAKREPDVASTFLQLLAALCDRWRDRRIPFGVLIVESKRNLAPIREILERKNEDLTRASLGPWFANTSPVPLFELRADQGRD
jgi:hypothetical protein